MAFLRPKTLLSAGERLERRRMMLSDTFSLSTLFVIAVLLALVTNAFYQSYASHQLELSRRWLGRGQASLERGDPGAAINALHSALALDPGNRNIETLLAEALAEAGRLQEASSYFNTLAESQPGEGVIQLHLARIAVRQGNAAQALEDYHRAIYGDWQGDGAVRRREARLEMVGFMLSTGRYTQARNELLVAAGNAPQQDTALLLKIGQSLEQARAPYDALNLYKSILSRYPTLSGAVQGAGRAAFQSGHYAEAARYLERASSTAEAARLPADQAQELRVMLSQSQHLLLLYPSPQLSLHNRGVRILADRTIAQARLASCMPEGTKNNAPNTANTPNAPNTPTAEPAPSNPPASHNPLRSLARRLERRAMKPAPANSPPLPSAELQDLLARWEQLPAKVTLADLEDDPELASTQIRLIYDTERTTAAVCGAPTDEDDILLLKIAQAPNAVDQD